MAWIDISPVVPTRKKPQSIWYQTPVLLLLSCFLACSEPNPPTQTAAPAASEQNTTFSLPPFTIIDPILQQKLSAQQLKEISEAIISSRARWVINPEMVISLVLMPEGEEYNYIADGYNRKGDEVRVGFVSSPWWRIEVNPLSLNELNTENIGHEIAHTACDSTTAMYDLKIPIDPVKTSAGTLTNISWVEWFSILFWSPDNQEETIVIWWLEEGYAVYIGEMNGGKKAPSWSYIPAYLAYAIFVEQIIKRLDIPLSSLYTYHNQNEALKFLEDVGISIEDFLSLSGELTNIGTDAMKLPIEEKQKEYIQTEVERLFE